MAIKLSVVSSHLANDTRLFYSPHDLDSDIRIMESGEITTFNKVNLYLVIARGHYAASLLKLIEVAARCHYLHFIFVKFQTIQYCCVMMVL